MLGTIIIVLIVLWFFGYMPISGISIPDLVLFSLNGHDITLWNILILLAVGWAINLLPQPLQAIASVLLLLWVLATLGVLTFIAGLPSIIVILIIVLLAVSLFR